MRHVIPKTCEKQISCASRMEQYFACTTQEEIPNQRTCDLRPRRPFLFYGAYTTSFADVLVLSMVPTLHGLYRVLMKALQLGDPYHQLIRKFPCTLLPSVI